jgi:pimeloyl-ACP methyl ester carboxylesterase
MKTHDRHSGIAGTRSVPKKTSADRVLPRLEGVEHRFVELPGLRMHVAEAGSGQPLVLLHEVTQHWWEWRKIIPELAQHYRVIAADLRGAGWTDAPAEGYTRNRQLADVVALLDKLQLESVGLLTHGWGSLVGYQLCLSHPHRVVKHLAVSIPPPYFRFDASLVLATLRHAWFDLVVPLPGIGPLLLARRTQWLARSMLLDSVYDPNALTEEDVEVFLAPLREPARARALSALYRHFLLPETARILSGAYRDARMKTPTLVLVGADDPIGPEFLHGIDEHVDDLAMEYVEGAGHFVADERSEAVIQRALEFFAKP